jgi:two-component system, OmpR family, sensor histidine kinase BaeS
MINRLPFRWRMLLGHILPVILLIPLVGLALIYLLEFRLIIPTLAKELRDQGNLLIRIAADHPDVWSSTTGAQALLDTVNMSLPTRFDLLDTQKILLATSLKINSERIGETIPHLPQAAGSGSEVPWAIISGSQPGVDYLGVVIAVTDENGAITGYVGVYRRITDILQSLTTMRLIVLGVLLVGLLLSGAIAVYLSESISRPIRAIARAIASAPLVGKADSLDVLNSEDFKDVIDAYNHLQQRRSELEEARQNMLANLVHEVGRPLGGIRAAAHALQAGAMDNNALRQDLVNGIADRIDQINRLLKDLTATYHHLQPQELDLEEVNLENWLYKMTPLWAEEAQEKGLSWSTHVEPDLPTFQTDPVRLAECLTNLVDNAFKFTAQGGKVIVGMKTSGGEVHIWVRDTGPGIPIEDQVRLFTPFYRVVHPAWKAPGLGLGLSITRSIVESLGGAITLESSLGEGSVFTIVLPLHKSGISSTEKTT